MKAGRTPRAWQDVPTDAVKAAAVRYRRPNPSTLESDPYFCTNDSALANEQFIMRLTRYRSSSLRSIIEAVKSDIDMLNGRMSDSRQWMTVSLVLAACSLYFLGAHMPLFLIPLIASGAFLAQARPQRERLNEAARFLGHLEGWMLLYTSASTLQSGKKAA